MVAMFPLHLEQQHLPGTESFYFDIDNTPGFNVTSTIPPFIYSVGPGNQFMLLDLDIFCAPSFAVGSFRYPCPSPCHLILIHLFSCHLKMAHKARCEGDHGGSTH